MSSAPSAIRSERINWLGLWTLCAREVRRFAKVYNQTVLAPVVTNLVFLAIFALALGGATQMVGDVPYLQFLAPGLVAMAIAQNAFANTSSSLIIAKIQGNIIDTLMPPLAPMELTIGFAFGGVTRGLLVGVVAALAMSLFVPLRIAHPFALAFLPPRRRCCCRCSVSPAASGQRSSITSPRSPTTSSHRCPSSPAPSMRSIGCRRSFSWRRT